MPPEGELTPVVGLFVGLTTIDIIFSLTSFPQEDSKNTASESTASAGGPATNAAVAFAFLGGSARLVSSLGIGGIASVARDDLTNRSVQHLDLTPERESPPALSAILIAEDSRTIVTSPAIDDEVEVPNGGLSETLDELVGQADVILLDGHQTKVAEVVAREATRRKKMVVLDGDLYGAGLEPIVPMVDVAIFGKSFSVGGLGNFDYFSKRGVRNIVGTNGRQPIEFSLDGRRGQIDVTPVKAVDTLGAGDFFHGAFCYWIACGLEAEDALARARDVAQQSVEHFGTRSWMDDR